MHTDATTDNEEKDPVTWKGPNLFEKALDDLYSNTFGLVSRTHDAICEEIYAGNLVYYERLEAKGLVPRVSERINQL